MVTALYTLGPLAAGEHTVYPLLRRLETDRHLETFAAESPAAPPQQYYQLTTKGRHRLAALEQEWAELVRAVARCLHRGVAA
ncbi:MAG: PadR family transcriptional regulator [Acidobacteria bacterium]|nr:PadR family transcriptional regulator [Acidobacteriota bacterium]